MMLATWSSPLMMMTEAEVGMVSLAVNVRLKLPVVSLWTTPSLHVATKL